MKIIFSFIIDYICLFCGIYVFRKDEVGGEMVIIFDICMKEFNWEFVLG